MGTTTFKSALDHGDDRRTQRVNPGLGCGPWALGARLSCKSRRSRQVIVAHRFIGGMARDGYKSVREADG